MATTQIDCDLLAEYAIAADCMEERGFHFVANALRDIARLQLLRFCDGFGTRLDLSKPFVRDGWLIATDARIAVRVRTTESNTEDDRKRPDMNAKMHGWLEAADETDTWRPFVKEHFEDFGPFQYSLGMPHGSIPAFRIGAKSFNSTYIDEIQGLKSLLVSVDSVSEHDDSPLLFKFLGGDGALMPLAQQAEASR